MISYYESVFRKHKCIISCHVDDFILGVTINFVEKVISLIKLSFQISYEGETFNYLGLTLIHDNKGIKISQKHYIDVLKEVEIEKERKYQG